MKQVSYKSARVVQKILVLFLLLLPCGIRGQTPSATPTEDTLEKLASDFWSWRAKYAPFTGDDVNRLEGPGGVRDWSAATIDKRGRGLKDFDARYQKIDADGWPVPQQVDYRLIGSALSTCSASRARPWNRITMMWLIGRPVRRRTAPMIPGCP